MGRDPYLEVRLAQLQDSFVLGELGKLAEEDWIEAREISLALLERYLVAGNAAVQRDLEAANEIASWGFQHTSGALRQEFATLLACVMLIVSRHETDPGRRAQVAGMARALCAACERIGDSASLRREVEVARLWEKCARTAGAEAEATEARSIVDQVLRRNPGLA